MIKPILLVVLVTLLAGCTQFSTRYDRIESDAIRNIGLVYQPYAEGAPGDTMHIRAYFAGEKAASVSWQYSISYINNGNDTIVNIMDLHPLTISNSLPDSIDISFIIPDSAFFTTQAISSAIINALKASLPSSMGSMTQQNFAAFLQDLGNISLTDPLAVAGFTQRWATQTDISPTDPGAMDSLTAISAKIVSAFSIDAVVFANVQSTEGHALKIKSDFTIRYNRRFANTVLAPVAPINRNPTLRWVGVYKVRNNVHSDFYPGNPDYIGKYTLNYLFNEIYPDSIKDTVVIDTGYTYYVAADSGMMTYTLKAGDTAGTGSNRYVLATDSLVSDTTRDKYHVISFATHRDTIEMETFYYNWLYQNLAVDSLSKPLDSLMSLPGSNSTGGGGMTSIEELQPSRDAAMTHAKIWAVVYDYRLGELNRPAGFAIRGLDIFFKYTNAYKLAHK
jgi:hypothetical protein